MSDLAPLTITFLREHPAEAAQELDRFPADDVADLFSALEPALLAPVLTRMIRANAALCLARLEKGRATAALAAVGALRAAPILRHMDEPARLALVEGLPVSTGTVCRLLLSYPLSVVGAWMDAQAPALPSNLTAREAAKRIRRDKPNPDAMPLRIVCVVDSDQRIEGVIDIDRLLRAGPRETLAQLMDRKTPSLSSRESLRAARDSPGWSERSALPVLNRQGRLVGVLHHAVLTRALHQESTQFQAKPHQDAALDLAGVYWMGVTALLQGGISYFTQAELKATPKVKRT